MMDALAVLLKFLLFRLIESLPDILMAGVGAFLLARNGRFRLVGAALLVLYIVAVIGSFIGDNPPRMRPDDHATVGPVLAILAGILGVLMSRVGRPSPEETIAATRVADATQGRGAARPAIPERRLP